MASAVQETINSLSGLVNEFVQHNTNDPTVLVGLGIFACAAAVTKYHGYSPFLYAALGVVANPLQLAATGKAAIDSNTYVGYCLNRSHTVFRHEFDPFAKKHLLIHEDALKPNLRINDELSKLKLDDLKQSITLYDDSLKLNTGDDGFAAGSIKKTNFVVEFDALQLTQLSYVNPNSNTVLSSLSNIITNHFFETTIGLLVALYLSVACYYYFVANAKRWVFLGKVLNILNVIFFMFVLYCIGATLAGVSICLSVPTSYWFIPYNLLNFLVRIQKDSIVSWFKTLSFYEKVRTFLVKFYTYAYTDVYNLLTASFVMGTLHYIPMEILYRVLCAGVFFIAAGRYVSIPKILFELEGIYKKVETPKATPQDSTSFGSKPRMYSIISVHMSSSFSYSHIYWQITLISLICILFIFDWLLA